MTNSFIWVLRARVKDRSTEQSLKLAEGYHMGSVALSLDKIWQKGLPLLGTAMPIEQR